MNARHCGHRVAPPGLDGRVRRPFLRRCVDAAGIALPGVALALMPKCPACLAAYVALGTGVGLSFSSATVLRWFLVAACVASLAFFITRRARPLLAWARQKNRT